MTSTTASSRLLFTPTAAPHAPAETLKPYIKEGSAEAVELRALLASAGFHAEGRPLAAAVREFQAAFNQGGAGTIKVDGKAGEETMGALRGHVGRMGPTDAVCGCGPQDAFAAFTGQGLDAAPTVGSAVPGAAVAGASLVTALQASGRSDAAARNVLEAKLNARGQGDPVLSAGAIGETIRRGINASGDGVPVRFKPPVGENAVSAAHHEARTSGLSQQFDLNGARVVVHPTDTLDAANARYAAALELPPVSFTPPVGRDAFEAAAREVDRTGRAQTWQHANGVAARVSPGETANYAAERFLSDSQRAGMQRRIDQRAAQSFGADRAPGTALVERSAAASLVREVAGESDSLFTRFANAAPRVVGRVAVPVGLAVDTIDIGSAMKRDAERADGRNVETVHAVGRAAGGWGGAAAGAAAGAAVGSIVPVVGTAIGAVVGGIAGGFGGTFLGESVAGLFVR